MSARKTQLIEGEFYHIYNRGTDKRIIFKDKEDVERFMQSMIEFNILEPIGSLYKNSFKKDKNNQLRGLASKLVEIIAYCLNGNHYHFILKQVSERGIEKFMQRLGTGYTSYFNNKYERSGVLFQGKFKSKHIDKDGYLTNLSAYVNLNYKVHQLRGQASQLMRSSWGEYIGGKKVNGINKVGFNAKSFENICNTKVVLNYFKSRNDYKKFALQSIRETMVRRENEKELVKILLE